MHRTSPPKPWERPGSTTPIRPAAGSPPRSPTPTPLTSLPSSLSSLTPTTPAPTSNTPRPPLRPWERRAGPGNHSNNSGSDYRNGRDPYYGGGGGYGRDNYNNNNNSYGGYGSGSYNRGYADNTVGYGNAYNNNNYNNNYGNNYGNGNGNGNGYGPHDKSLRGSSFFNNLQYFVDSFSRFSRLLDANYDAMHGSFASVVRLLEHMGRLNFEVMTVVKTFAVFRIIQSILSRTLGALSIFLPWRAITSSTSSSSNSVKFSVSDFQKFANSTTPTNTSPPTRALGPHTPPSWRTLLVVFLVTFVGLPIAVNKMFSLLSRRSDNLELEWGKDSRARGGEGEQVEALHDFRGESDRELSFHKGDVLIVLNKFHPDWWEATRNGQTGLVPSSYVALIPTEECKDVEPMHGDGSK